MKAGAERLRDRVVHTCTLSLPDRDLRARVLEQVRELIDFDAYAWLLTDPVTWVGTAPLASVPDLDALPQLIRAKYLTSTNRWTTLPANRCVTLSAASERRGPWPELLQQYGVTDVASLSLIDRYGSWGFLDLWRHGGPKPTFSPAETALLSSLAAPLATALRRTQAATFTRSAPRTVAGGSAVLVLTDDLLPRQQTSKVQEWLRTLLPTSADTEPVPAAAFNVAAQLLAVEAGVDDHEPAARAHLADGIWITVRASRLAGDGSGPGQIAVTLEPIAATDHVEIFARTHGLSSRERQLLHELVRGHDTAGIAATLYIGAHTVQDHLKSIFTKTQTGSRYELISRAAGTQA